MMFISRPAFARGLTILESLAVLFTSVMLIIVLVPVGLVQMGYYKLPEPEITAKGIIIDGKEVVSKKTAPTSPLQTPNRPPLPISTPPTPAVGTQQPVKPASSPAPSPASADKPAPPKPAEPTAAPTAKP